MTRLVRGGSSMAGFPVGILCLNTRHPLLPGNVQHAGSFVAPVLYEIVDVDDPWALMRGEERLAEPILRGARALVARGVGAVVGACGSFAYYQKVVAAELPVPTFLSILTQISFLLQALGPARKLGVICAAASSMTPRVFEACDIREPDRLVIREMRGSPAFDRLLKGELDFDADAMEEETVAIARSALRDDPAIGAFLLQCSDLPPFGAAVRAATGLPVFDMTLLIRWLQTAIDYPHYG